MDTSEASSLNIETAAGLRTVISRLVKILRKETKNDEMLSLTERSTLALIDQHTGLLPTDLAAMEKVTTQSMSQVINKLSGMGYVHRAPSEQDKRKVILTLTPAGKTFIDQKRQEKQEWLARAIGEKLSQKEKEVLTEAIGVLTKLVD